MNKWVVRFFGIVMLLAFLLLLMNLQKRLIEMQQGNVPATQTTTDTQTQT